MLLLDNLSDIVMIKRKVQKCVEIDYDQLNNEKADEDDPKKLMDKVMDKIKQF